MVLGALLLYGYSGVLTVWTETPCIGNIACQVKIAVSPLSPTVLYLTLVALFPTAALAGWRSFEQWQRVRAQGTAWGFLWAAATALLLTVASWSVILLALSTLDPGFASVLFPSSDALVLTLFASLLGMPVVTLVAGAGMCGHVAWAARAAPHGVEPRTEG